MNEKKLPFLLFYISLFKPVLYYSYSVLYYLYSVLYYLYTVLHNVYTSFFIILGLDLPLNFDLSLLFEF